MEEEIERELSQLEEMGKELEPSSSKREEIFAKYHLLSERFLNELSLKNTFNDATSIKELYTIKEKPEKPSKTLQTLKEDLFEKGINAASGGHLGYIPGGGIYTAAIGDYLAATSNVYGGVYYASPGAVEMEHACLDWLKSIFHFPKSAVGNLTSGGSIANLIGLGAARDYQDVLKKGAENCVLYLTDQTHHSVRKSLKILGLQFLNIQTIKTDGFNRMDPNDLKNQIHKDKQAGLIPTIIIASAGTTDTGSVDPLEEI